MGQVSTLHFVTASYGLYLAAVKPTQHFRRDSGNILARSLAVRPAEASAIANQHIGAGRQGEGEEERGVEENAALA
jgi:hypothetical protein